MKRSSQPGDVLVNRTSEFTGIKYRIDLPEESPSLDDPRVLIRLTFWVHPMFRQKLFTFGNIVCDLMEDDANGSYYWTISIMTSSIPESVDYFHREMKLINASVDTMFGLYRHATMQRQKVYDAWEVEDK